MVKFEDLKAKLQEIKDIEGALALMAWDQEVMMSPGSALMRARQLSTLSGLVHSKFIDEAGPMILELQGKSINKFEEANLFHLKRDLDKKTKLPLKFVIELSRLTSEAQQAWDSAKKESKFSLFQPKLQALVDLKIEEAGFYGYEENPYDALIDSYEPGIKSTTIQTLFTSLKAELTEILKKIDNQPVIDDTFLYQKIDKDVQWKFGLDVLKTMGYDFSKGRQDISSHPFSISMNMDDVRVTTRLSDNNLMEMLYSTIHEGGHALYEQALPVESYGLPAAEACSLSIHESQSRLWENNVGRGLEFWQFFFPKAKSEMPQLTSQKDAFGIFQAVNKVERNLIRIAADELTYHFHIMLRFELENDLLNKRLEVKDLPEAWNGKIKQYLGLDVPSDSKGVLQDIHWSHGSFGYFPTYSLGSMYAAQFYYFAAKEVNGLDTSIASGNFLPLKTWLNEKIHTKGRTMFSEQLCEAVTGEKLNTKYFIDYVKSKFSKVYKIKL